MEKLTISDADHDRISAAVSAAEGHTDGEIVTIIAPKSDSYHDVGLHYAIAAMLALLTIVAAFPQHFSDFAIAMLGGWNHELSIPVQLSLLLGAMILVFLLVRYALAWMDLRMMLTPGATKSRRVRRRAVTLFRACAQGRTKGRTAIMLYLSVAEHRAEIIADETISAEVAPERWGDAMAALVSHLHKGETADGMIEAIGMIGVILNEHVPKSHGNPNELPDRLIEL